MKYNNYKFIPTLNKCVYLVINIIILSHKYNNSGEYNN